MQMTNSEIAASYRLAADPKKQIGILADLNDCTRTEIVDALRKEGIKLPGNYNAKKVETPEAAMQQPETPESPGASWNTLLDALVKSDKKVTVLEDILDIFAGAIEDFREAPEEVDRIKLAEATLSYMAGVVDAFKAINGPIIR